MKYFSEINRLKKLFLNNQKKKILIIAGKKSYYKSGSNLFFKKLLKKNLVKFYFKNKSFPEIKEVIKLSDKIKKIKPDVILCIGGGSVIDISKIANTVDIINNKPIYKLVKKKTKLIAIPLTAGSGAEVTSTAVLYFNKKKISIENNQIQPDDFFLIPQLVKNAPKKIKGPSIFDAIAQSIESIFSVKSNKKSINYSLKSLKISLKYYKNYYRSPNLSNCKKMLEAANLSGKAINISRTTAPHAISYPFVSLFNYSHGKAVAVSFTEVLRYNYFNLKKAPSKNNVKKKFDLIFRITNTKNIDEFTEFLKKIIIYLGIKTNLNDKTINLKKNLKKIMLGVNLRRLKNNPVPIRQNQIKKILKQSC